MLFISCDCQSIACVDSNHTFFLQFILLLKSSLICTATIKCNYFKMFYMENTYYNNNLNVFWFWTYILVLYQTLQSHCSILLAWTVIFFYSIPSIGIRLKQSYSDHLRVFNKSMACMKYFIIKQCKEKSDVYNFGNHQTLLP